MLASPPRDADNMKSQPATGTERAAQMPPRAEKCRITSRTRSQAPRCRRAPPPRAQQCADAPPAPLMMMDVTRHQPRKQNAYSTTYIIELGLICVACCSSSMAKRDRLIPPPMVRQVFQHAAARLMPSACAIRHFGQRQLMLLNVSASIAILAAKKAQTHLPVLKVP